MKKVKLYSALFIFIFVLFVAHNAYSQEGIVAPEVVKNDVAVMEEVSAPLVTPGNVTLNFKDADIRAVLNYFAEVSNVDIVPAPDIAGQITMKLTDKPWDTALDILVRNYGYVLVREGDVIRVVKKESLEGEEVVTEVIRLNYLLPGQALELDLLEVDKEGVKRRETISDLADLGGITQLLTAIKAILKPGETAVFLPPTNSIVVTAIPARINRIKKMTKEVDVRQPQIMLEAKIVEIELEKDERMGIDWTIKITASGAKRPTTLPFDAQGNIRMVGSDQVGYYPRADAAGTAGFLSDAAGITRFPNVLSAATGSLASFTFGTLDFTSFEAVLQMLSERDNTKVLATPRITTLSNHNAYIKVTTNIFLEESTPTTELATTQTTSFETDAREVGIILEILPHVNTKGEISVTLQPRVDGTVTFTTLPVVSGDDRVVMEYTSRTAKTQVVVDDGETIFIGGLIGETKTMQDHRVPLLGDLFGDVPFLGPLFTYKSEDVTRNEIVIFVTVHLVKNLRKLKKIGSEGFSQLEELSEHSEKEMEEPAPEEKTQQEEEGVEEPKNEHVPLFDFRKK